MEFNEAYKLTVLVLGLTGFLFWLQLALVDVLGIKMKHTPGYAIEQNHDKYGIKWPDALSPFQVALIPMNMHKSHRVAEVADKLYSQLVDAGIDVLFDDRKERPGVMFNDMELIGVTHTIVIGERNLDEQLVEYKHRRSGDKEKLAIDNVVEFIQNQLPEIFKMMELLGISFDELKDIHQQLKK